MSFNCAPGTARSVACTVGLSRPVVVPLADVITGGGPKLTSCSTAGAPGGAINGCEIANPACVATSGAQPCTCAVSRSDPLWNPAVSESPRNTVVVKFPAFSDPEPVVEPEFESEQPPIPTSSVAAKTAAAEKTFSRAIVIVPNSLDPHAVAHGASPNTVVNDRASNPPLVSHSHVVLHSCARIQPRTPGAGYDNQVKIWTEISEPNLQHNFAALQASAGPEITVLAVIKANAYGHGANLCAPILARAGARWIGGTDPAEGVAVRSALTSAGFDHQHQPRILILCGTVLCGTPSDDTAAILDAHLTPVVWTTDQIRSLDKLAQASTSRRPIPIHLEIDTGMARQVAEPGRALDGVLAQLAQSPNLPIEGVLTHFASAEVPGADQTTDQMHRFETALDTIIAAGQHPTSIHAGSSSTLNTPPPTDHADIHPVLWLRNLAARVGARAMVRSGLALYGYCLPVTERPNQPVPQICPALIAQLRPALTWKTQILSVRDVAPGATVGYGATFVAPHPMRLALLPVGYADGLRRELSSASARPGGWVMIHGQPAPIVGRISMNLTVVDVTSILSATPGDEAILLGPGITADVHARLANTLSYEILCGIRAQTTTVATGLKPTPAVASAKASI